MTMAKNQEQLLKELSEAGELVEIGGEYIHYKDNSKTYRVIELAIEEATDEVCVVYKANYGEGLVSTRPLESWIQNVVVGDKKVPRFCKRSND